MWSHARASEFAFSLGQTLGALRIRLCRNLSLFDWLRLQGWCLLLKLCILIRCQVLILSPTRELAQQTEKVILAVGDFLNIQAHACVGGKSLGEDIRKLEAGVHAVSGTPGRVFDMIKRKSLATRNIKTLILDEADEMLAKNFKDQIYDIYRCWFVSHAG